MRVRIRKIVAHYPYPHPPLRGPLSRRERGQARFGASSMHSSLHSSRLR